MAHTYVQNLVHIVFSTKERRGLISKETQARLWGYITGVCKQERIFVHEIGGMDDHAHMLIQLPRQMRFSRSRRVPPDGWGEVSVGNVDSGHLA
jgi:REP element-mobilizing transposase RayT